MATAREKRLKFAAMLRAKPRIDPSAVGISFVDVLFALVVGYAITPLATWWKIPVAGWLHLVTALVLTLTSWIGYHNSRHRLRFVIGMTNLPLVQFMLDIALVVVYAFAVFTAEGVTNEASGIPAVFPEALIVAITFFLYLIWDEVASRIWHSEKYRTVAIEFAKKKGDPVTFGEDDTREGARRKATPVFFGIAAIVALIALCKDRSSTGTSLGWNYGINITLWVVLVTFRLAKEYFNQNGEPGAQELSN